MSQENIEIVRAALDAFNRGDWDGVFREATPSSEWDISRAAGPYRGVYRPDQFREVIAEFAGTWGSGRITADEYIEAGEHVVVPWTFRGEGRDGVEVQARVTWNFTIRAGAIERVCMYQERREAFEAAGLQE